MATPVAFPEGCFKLQELRGSGSWRRASWVIDTFLRPPNDLAEVVVAGADGIVAAEPGKLRHHSMLPHERDAGIPANQAEGRTREGLVQRIVLTVFRYAGDQPEIVLDGPGNVAAWTSERTEWDLRTICPECRKLNSIGFGGEAGYPADVVNCIAGADRAAERTKVNYAIVLWT